ncbi:hypothetical protein KY389_12165 [Paracoccus bogoriensis]|nr:hypothetical protein [Paracoccus bogoriensis]
MTTTLAHYQLPLFGIASPALQTEIGADQRSLFLRPITAIGSLAEPAGAKVISDPQESIPAAEFRTWLKSLQRYENSARKSDDGSKPAEAVPSSSGEDGAEPRHDAASPTASAQSEAASRQSARSESARPAEEAAPAPNGSSQTTSSGESPQGQPGLIGRVIRF